MLTSRFTCLAALIFVLVTQGAHAASPSARPAAIPIVDGSFVHDVGTHSLNVTNWGLLGSRYSSESGYQHAPSAEFPAGSDVQHLFAAGLWIGGMVYSEPMVTTGQFHSEMSADPTDSTATIEIVTGPERLGDQHFRAIMRDDYRQIVEANPSHSPMGMEIEQETFQFAGDGLEAAIGLRYTIRNVGRKFQPYNGYLGFFMDPDIGHRDTPNPGADDLVGHYQGTLSFSDGTSMEVDLAYAYDDDGDNGTAPGFIGVVALDNPIHLAGECAPRRVGFETVRFWRGTEDPTSDADRFGLLAGGEWDAPPTPDQAGDWRILITPGWNCYLPWDQPMKVEFALVAANSLAELKALAARVRLVSHGVEVDADQDPATGVLGRETRICWQDYGPNGPINPIYTMFQDCVTAEDLLGPDPPAPIRPEELDEDGCIFIDNDCHYEFMRRPGQGTCERAPGPGCTGLGGREHTVRWQVPEEVPVSAVLANLDATALAGGGARVIARVENGSTAMGLTLVRVQGTGLPPRSWPLVVADGATVVIDDHDPGPWPRSYELVVALGDMELVVARAQVAAPLATGWALRATASAGNIQLEYSAARGPWTISLVDVRGRRLAGIASGPDAVTGARLGSGMEALVGGPLARGSYLVVLEGPGRKIARKLLLR